MESRLIKLRGTSLEELRHRVLAEHGEQAQLMEAEKVTVGGIAGFLSRRYYEGTVRLPPPPVPLNAPGCLVLVAGLGEEAVQVCASMAAAAGCGAEALRAAAQRRCVRPAGPSLRALPGRRTGGLRNWHRLRLCSPAVRSIWPWA